MTRITVPQSLNVQLDTLSEPAELVDETGRSLGHFVPTANSTSRDECPCSPEELERMRNEEGGRPLAEIWKSLGV